MAVFFSKIDMRHGERVPDTGPVIFVANHPNSIMDALVMGLVTKRKVNYLGHAGLFSNRLKAWFLRSCGVIPVYRREDAPDKMEQNISAFEACFQALEQGETIGIFPEGTSDLLRKVKKVKTGAARIALEAERRNGYQLGLTVLPIGLYFFSRSRFRSRVLLNVGQPIALSSYCELNEQDNYEAVQQFTDEIQRRLEQLTVNIQHEELDEFVRDIEVLYRDDLKQELIADPKVSETAYAEFFLTQKIAECVEYYYARDRNKVLALRERLNFYKRKLKRLHLKDAMLKERANFGELVRANSQTVMKAIIGLPLAIYGFLNHVLPYLITEQIAKRFIDDRTKILSALLIGGSLTFLLFYSVQIFIIWYWFGQLRMVLYGLSLPVSGLFTLTYIKELRLQQERLNLSFFLFTNRRLFQRMRRERRKLIAELNAIKNEYLQQIRLTPEAKLPNRS